MGLGYRIWFEVHRDTPGRERVCKCDEEIASLDPADPEIAPGLSEQVGRSVEPIGQQGNGDVAFRFSLSGTEKLNRGKSVGGRQPVGLDGRRYFLFCIQAWTAVGWGSVECWHSKTLGSGTRSRIEVLCQNTVVYRNT